MVFSSPVFIFLFLPVTLALYFSLGTTLKNVLLLTASIVFYAYGEGWLVLLMIASILINWGAALLFRPGAKRRNAIIVWAAVLLNLSFLFYYKYTGFFVETLNQLLVPIGLAPLYVGTIHLPAGVSFFTFQALSYLLDIYRGRYPVQRDPAKIALYVALFPQLVAGPIVRYGTIANALVKRTVTGAWFLSGLRRFIIGLAKKVLIANTLAVPVDRLFSLGPNEMGTPHAYIGAFLFALQIYFDFSGYSDMAIGLGKMLGFRFLENFNYPYLARSAGEFWRRWHISLSTWFRDYLYQPLFRLIKTKFPKSRTGSSLAVSTAVIIMFVLIGLWHGAAWTFILFGLAHGILISLERGAWGRFIERLGPTAGHIYFMCIIITTFTLFRADSLPRAAQFWKAAVGMGGSQAIALGTCIDSKVIGAALVGLLCSFPFFPALYRRSMRKRSTASAGRKKLIDLLAASVLILILSLLFGMSILHGSMESYNPFVYFRF